MSHDLSQEFLRVVEEAAIASARTMGKGEREFADQAAVESMRRSSLVKAIETRRRCSTSARRLATLAKQAPTSPK
jgi:fructose-1,6-bisphosphatase/sedoheptulose 1,7-bisphosphatase-like protein